MSLETGIPTLKIELDFGRKLITEPGCHHHLTAAGRHRQ